MPIRPQEPKFKVRQLPKRADNIPNYSSAFPLEPRGLGSGQIECLTGYVMRLADFHWMTTGSFMNQVLKPMMSVDTPQVLRGNNRIYSVANGYRKYAARLSEAVTKATAEIDARFLTFLPWARILDQMGHGLTKNHLEWCTACWQEDMALGESPYVRLAWLAQPVALCPHHHRDLHTFCPHCGNHQQIFPVIPRPWICHSCGNDLTQARRGQILKGSSNNKASWVATAIERLIQRTCSSGLILSENSLQVALRHLIMTHGDGSYRKLAQLAGVDENSLRLWATGQYRPFATALLDLCYRIDIPPDNLLLDGPALTSPEIWRKGPAPHFVSLVKLGGTRLKQIKSALQQLITKNPDPPPLISDVAESLDITYSVIKYHFPDEYRILRKRSTEYRKYVRTKEGQIRMEKFVSAVQSLLEKGIYPSERQLKQLGYVRAGELRRPELIQKLRELQAEYSDLPIVIRNRRKKNGGIGLEISKRRKVRDPGRKTSTPRGKEPHRGSRAKRQSRATGTQHS